MDKKFLKAVATFHEKFGIPVHRNPTGKVDPSLWALRHKLMEEENREYLASAQKGDLIGVADALGDMLYVLCGTILQHGLQEKIEAVFWEIHKSNMTKLSREGTSIYRADGKVGKGPDFLPPDIASIVK